MWILILFFGMSILSVIVYKYFPVYVTPLMIIRCYEQIKNGEKLKLKTIADIKDAGLEVEKIIINSNLTEEEAFAAEASLINAFNYVSDAGLTNIVAGHHSAEALSVDEYERINGAVEPEEKDIRHKILVIKINRLYQRGMDEKVLYDAVRGVWRA